MKLSDLTIEYRRNPLGLDHQPRFSWKIQSEKQNTMQAAYQISVWEDEAMVWDSGRIESEQSLFVIYDGAVLKPFTYYQVSVTVWDNHGNSAQTEGNFETGLLNQDNLQAKWITHMLPEEERACPIFFKEYTAKGKIKNARVYVTCCGVYEMSINGKKVGVDFLTPGWTSYRNRLQYQTYDITPFFTDNNEISIVVGNGWYKGYLNGEGKSCFYGERTAVVAMLRIVYADGTVDVIGTDTDWKVSTGIIRESELYHGEKQDLTVDTVMLKNDCVQAVLFDESEKISSVVAQESELVRITKRIPAKEKIITPSGEIVIDFGQNMAGFVELRLPELTGETLRIFHAEVLDKEGNFYTENLRTARSMDEYIYAKEDEGKVLSPHFTYHGFRYIKVEGVDEKIDIAHFTACVIHTDMQKTGSFHCSHPMIEQLQSNIEWGERSNFVDIPTDCPQRDERLGWTGDAQIFCRTAVYNFNAALFFKKWLRDVAAETDMEYGVPHMVPNIVGPATGTAVWGDCATIIPWIIYHVYGDEGVLREQYENMKQWVDYIHASCGEKTLWMNGFQRGDWLSLDGDISLPSMSGGTDKNLVANAYYAYSVKIVRDAAKVLGRTSDAAYYGEVYEHIVEELNREYVTQNGRLVSETQTACVLLLRFNLVKEKHRSRIIQTLTENIARHKGHLTTGFVGTAYLCHTLTENAKHSLAEEILLTEEYPGWLYAVKKGATTIWERWNSILPDGNFDESGMNSLNHYSYGSIGDFLYQKIGGINLLKPGYKEILIKPVLTQGMTEVAATYESMYGTIDSKMTCKDGQITVDVMIPPNTKAVLELPEREERIVIGSGTYHYEYETGTNLSVKKIRLSSTIGELLESKNGKDILDKYLPGISNNGMLAFMKGKTLNELAEMAPGQRSAITEMVQEAGN